MKLWNILGVFGLVGSFLPSMSGQTTDDFPPLLTSTREPLPTTEMPSSSTTTLKPTTTAKLPTTKPPKTTKAPKTTTLHPPTTTTVRPTPDFYFPVKNEACPSNFPAEILYSYNKLRKRFNFTDLRLTSELNQAAERISLRTQRCYENCRPLNRKFPAVGQDYYTQDGDIKKTQFKLRVPTIISKITQFQKKGMPYYFDQRSRQFIEYSEEEWGKIEGMGVACATYVVSGRKGAKWKTVNRLKITFTFEKPKFL